MLNYDRRGRVEDHRVAAFFQAQLEAGESYASITAARKAIAQELGRAIAPGTPEAKAVDEVIELALVNVSRKLVKDASPIEAFDKLVDLYNRQPTLGVRSSTSARQQAYSTVLPIAYLVSQLAGISKSSRVYEPTAGNGALLIGADPKSCTVNELNSDRAAQLRSQGFSVTEHDATEYLPEEKHDVVIANPPFGRVKGKRFRLPGNPRGTSQIDQAIAR